MTIKQLIKKSLPNSLKKTIAEGWRHFGSPPQSIKNLLAFNGNFDLKIEEKNLKLCYTNRWVENDAFWKGIAGYEKESMRIWIKACKHADTVADIGANTGLFSLVAKTVNPESLVYAFEPLPIFRDVFLANCALNNYKINVNSQALSNYTGKSVFYVPKELQGNVYSSSLSLDHYLKHQTTTPIQVEVEVITFDSFFETQKTQSLDLVKIDAEGHDYQVLEGMIVSIAKYQPDFLIEIQSNEVGNKIMKLLPPDTYLYFNINEATGAKLVSILGVSDTLNFFVCKHSSATKLGLTKFSD